MYLNAHLSAMILTEFIRELLKICFERFFFQTSPCIFKEARILKNYQIYKLIVASYMYNILKQV